MRIAFTLVLFGLWFAATREAFAEEASAGKIVTAVYGLPPGFFYTPSGPTEPRTDAQLLPGVHVVSETGSSPSGKVYDVKGWLEAMGILFPPGSEALYFFERSQLIVRNTKENLELISSLNDCNIGMGYPIHKSEITLVAFNPSAERLGNPTASFDQLKKNARDSWKEIVTLQLVSKSGLTVHSQAILGQKSVPVSAPESDTTGPASVKAPDLPPGAEGNTCALQIVVGPDRRTIDANLSFRLRSVLPGSKKPLTIQFDGSTTVQDGYPQVLQIVEPAENGPAYALVLRITGVLPETTQPLSIEKDTSRVSD